MRSIISSLLFLFFSVVAWSANIKIKTTDNLNVSEIVVVNVYGNTLIPVKKYDVKGNTAKLNTKDFESAVNNNIFGLQYENQLLKLFLPQEDVELTLSTDFNATQVEGNDVQKELLEHQFFIAKNMSKLREIESSYRDILPLRQSNPNEFNNQFAAIRGKVDALNQEKKNYYTSKQSTLISDLLKQMYADLMLTEYTSKLNFFNQTEWLNKTYAGLGYFEEKINLYFSLLSPPNQGAFADDATEILKMAPPASVNRQLAFQHLIEIALSVDQQAAMDLSSAYKKEFKDHEIYKAVKNTLPQGPPSIGDEAPEIELASPAGTPIALSSLKGKYVLLDFWASWCGPCRRENPNVVRLYNEYKDKGFTVYSVSLDGNKSSWLSAIEKDGLDWPNHVSDLKKWQNVAAREYQVSGIPSTFLLDKNGVIIEKNLRGVALENKLKELLGD